MATRPDFASAALLTTKRDALISDLHDVLRSNSLTPGRDAICVGGWVFHNRLCLGNSAAPYCNPSPTASMPDG